MARIMLESLDQNPFNMFIKMLDEIKKIAPKMHQKKKHFLA
jgi:hypothetical protein